MIFSPRRLCLFLLLFINACLVRGGNDTDDDVDLIQPMIDWIKELGGDFSNKMEIRTAHGTGRFGIFAKEDISEDESLITIPREVLITDQGLNDDGQEYDGLWCPTAWNLLKEMKLGEESKYAPYITYLKAQPRGQLPSGWSKPGMRLLLEVVGQHDHSEDNDLPPEDAVGWIYNEWTHVCGGTDDPDEVQAALLLLQRGWDDVMIPVYDLMSHRNGPWLNTAESTTVHSTPSEQDDDDDEEEEQDKPPIVVRATRDIQAGEEIYTTYNHCLDCGGRKNRYGTPEILRDYGFVENYPQRWYFHRQFYFDIEETKFSPISGDDDDDDDEPSPLVVVWKAARPPTRIKEEMRADLFRLRDMEEMDLASPDPAVPQHEFEVIVNYHKAMKSAIELALDFWNFSYSDDSVCSSDNDDEVCSDAAAAVAIRYDELEYESDETNYAVYTCDTDISMNFDDFNEVEVTKSHYQDLNFAIHPGNDNVCFDIGNTIQICGSYRPHYHEMVVHYTARFLRDIKRVIWVGGGDSMLLHEIIKYKSLEFVVGLEIDQVVTRLAFKHFGSQPHFDNPKVQWWYGDAAKSLLMLPKSYFGSFDMVLVDLSETVTSALVTDKLDIMQALSLLLKPDGILVKNELYMEQMSDIFTYSLQIHYNWVPVICSQCLILGSHSIDFLYESLTEHDLDSPNLYIQPLDKIEDRYEFYHDYRRNSSAVHLCKHDDDDEDAKILDETGSEQQRSPGILMIVEVEDVTVDLTDVDAVKEAIVTAATTSAGMTNAKATHYFPGRSKNNAIVSVLLGEGYIVARTWPEFKYVALDIHFWSSFEKQEATKKAIVEEALGSDISSKSSSSYRIVAGGMFGVPTWKEDEKNRGPRVTDKCRAGEDDDSLKVRDKKTDTSVFDVLLEETLKLIPQQGYTAAVVCGSNHDEQCSSLKVVSNNEAIARVLPLVPCSGLTTSDYQEGVLEKMMSCERELFKMLTGEFSTADGGSGRIRALVIDPTAPRQFVRIVYKLLRAKSNRFLFTRQLYAVTAMFTESDEWRRNLMERFRKDIIFFDPNYRVQVLFNGTDTSMELDMTVSGDEHFVDRFMGALSTMEDRTKLVSDVRDVVGGVFWEDPEWKEDYFFLPEDFDQSGPLEQYMSQQPVAYQTVFQMEPSSTKRTEEVDKVSFTIEELQEVVTAALVTSTIVERDNDDDSESTVVTFHVDSSMGDGFAIHALFPGGNCILLWDGRKHVDLNLFTHVESKELADGFEGAFRKQLFRSSRLTTTLKDIQPRGYGRAVNFQVDLEQQEGERTKPHWAKFK